MSNVDKYRYRKPLNSRLKRVNPIFQLQDQESDSKELSSHLIKLARKSGQLNLSGKGLATGNDILGYDFIFKIKLNLWLTAPRGATPVN